MPADNRVPARLRRRRRHPRPRQPSPATTSADPSSAASSSNAATLCATASAPATGTARSTSPAELLLQLLAALAALVAAAVAPFLRAVSSLCQPSASAATNKSNGPIVGSDSASSAATSVAPYASRATAHIPSDSAEELVRFWGYPFETHHVTTTDGYILALHRIPHGHSNEPTTSDHQQRPCRPVVLLWHGFMMCSEIWVCAPDPAANLALVLADAGFDVWLGNSRGNKYSANHTTYDSATDDRFWDFSLDHLARYDLPAAVDAVLAATGAETLAYVGFSQGTMQAFAALALDQEGGLSSKLNVFVALAPVTKPHPLPNRALRALASAPADLSFLLLGRRATLPSGPIWRALLPRRVFAAVIDVAVRAMFAWSSDALAITNKVAVYQHLYAATAVKVVVHWFQILNSARFQAFDDDGGGSTKTAAVARTAPARFSTENIRTPYAMFWGGRDSLTDLDYILDNTPAPVFCLKVEEYEHLSLLWGPAVNRLVFPGVLGLVRQYAPKTAAAAAAAADTAVSAAPLPPTVPGDDLVRAVLAMGKVYAAPATAADGTDYDPDDAANNTPPCHPACPGTVSVVAYLDSDSVALPACTPVSPRLPVGIVAGSPATLSEKPASVSLAAVPAAAAAAAAVSHNRMRRSGS
ncbi:cholesterol esterase [Cladochytrium tenue]|nr:cholesterol esterase [Cladochytrium tenue]